MQTFAKYRFCRILVSFMNDITNSTLFILWLTSGLAFLSTIVLALNIFKIMVLLNNIVEITSQ